MGTDKANATTDVADSVVDGVADSPTDDVTGPADDNEKAAGAPVDDKRSAPEATGSPAAEAPSDDTAAEPTDEAPTPPLGAPAPAAEPARERDAEWREPGAWQPGAAAARPDSLAPASADAASTHHRDDLAEPDDVDEDEWYEEYQDSALFASIFSAPSLALAAFVFAFTGLLGGMIPQSLPYLVNPLDPQANPAYLLGLIMMGFAIIAASLGLAAMLRSIGSPLNWPRYLGGAAVLLALLMALQSVLMIVLGSQGTGQGGMS